MKQYKELLQHILDHGEKTDDRTGVGTLSVFGYQMRFNLQDGFPAVTTKKLAWRACVGELLWFLEGSTDERRLAELTYGLNAELIRDKTTIWTANANAQGKDLGWQNSADVKELGPVYGHQWRDFNGRYDFTGQNPGLDQIDWVVNEIKTNPTSRRLIVSAWNPNQLQYMALPPCHLLFQFKVTGNKLSCMMTQRSADCFLGIPFNIASYALLTHLIARECELEVGDLIMSLGDAHIYSNHLDQVQELLARETLPLPTLAIDPKFNLSSGLRYGFKVKTNSYLTLENYTSHDKIFAPMAV